VRRDILGVVTGLFSVLFSWVPGVGLVLGTITIALAGPKVSRREGGLAYLALSLGIFGLVVGVVVLALTAYLLLALR
jgi:uncharacterized protein YqgC (DUF456 family)